MLPLYVAGGVVAGLALLAIAFWSLWRVAEPDHALIVAGLGVRRRAGPAGDLGFRVVTGTGALRLPGLRRVHRFGLHSRTAELAVDCVTAQGLAVTVHGTVLYKVGDDVASIANAARRFCGRPEAMNPAVEELCTGHLRCIVGSMTVEELVHNRDTLTAEVRRAAASELAALGLMVDSVQVQRIDEESGYLANLGRPHAAALAAQARIAEAQRDQEATQAEQIAAAKKAAAVRDSQVQQAEYQAEVDRTAAVARQAGALAEAGARQQVLAEKVRAAQAEADLAELALRSEVRLPAEARAYQAVTAANADRDARIAEAQAEARRIELLAQAEATRTRTAAAAEAEATVARAEAGARATRLAGDARAAAAETTGRAEAEALRARSGALASGPEAAIARHLIDRLPQVVAAGARALGAVERAVPESPDGVSELLARAVALGGTGIGLARTILSGNDGTLEKRTNGVEPRADNARPGEPGK